MSVRFYRLRDEAPARPPTGLNREIAIASWRPARDGAPHDGPCLAENLAWFAFDRLGVFSTRSFEELTLWRYGRLVHRLVVTPRWFRFPFMGDYDLQIGALWTDPQFRRRGLATTAIGEAHRRHAAPGRSLWCLAHSDNPASIRLAESCGYRVVGRGRRTRPLGVRALGRYVMDRPTALGQR